MDNRTRRTAFVVLGWTLFALFMTGQSIAYRTQTGQLIDMPALLVREFSYAYVWAFLTPLVLRASEWLRIERPHRVRNILLHLLLSVLISVIHKVSAGVIDAAFSATRGQEFSWTVQVQGVLAYFDYGILIYWILLLMKLALDYYRRFHEQGLKSSQLEAQLARAKLQALRMQINPHFLFNTLNAISVLVDKDPPAARQTIGRLGDLLRLALDHNGEHEIPLGRELEFLGKYLQIEQTRFGDRLTVSIDVPPELLGAAVPSLILQPVVENSIKHGVSKHRGNGRIDVSARATGNTLVLSVSDTNAGAVEGADVREGIGIGNTRSRLQSLYGDKARLSLTSRHGSGVLAMIEIPLHTVSQEQG
jgi:hypothetical protein